MKNQLFFLQNHKSSTSVDTILKLIWISDLLASQGIKSQNQCPHNQPDNI